MSWAGTRLIGKYLLKSLHLKKPVQQTKENFDYLFTVEKIMLHLIFFYWMTENKLQVQQLHIEKYHRFIGKQKSYYFWYQYYMG